MLEVKTTGSDEYGKFLKALICGRAGAGKTLISSTFPNPLYASAEAGLMSIADRSIPYVEIKSSSDVRELGTLLRQSAEVREQIFHRPVETLVVDTIDWIQKIYIRERLQSQKKDVMGRDDWNWLGEIFRPLLRGLISLDMNVVLCCHLKDTMDDQSGSVAEVPALQGALGDEITQYVDLATFIATVQVNDVVGDKIIPRQVRYLQTYKDGAHTWVKDRSGRLDPEIAVNFEDDFDRIHAAIYGNVDLAESTSITVGSAPAEPATVVQSGETIKTTPAKRASRATKKAAPKADVAVEPVPTPPTESAAEAPTAQPDEPTESIAFAGVDLQADDPAAAMLAQLDALREKKRVAGESTSEPIPAPVAEIEPVLAAEPAPEPESEVNPEPVDVPAVVDALVAAAGSAVPDLVDTTVSEPEPVTAETASVASVASDEDDETGPWICAQCGVVYDDFEQFELSMIVVRESQCEECLAKTA